MDVGTGIFLGAIFLGVVGLYITTRDRWNWRKLILRPLLALVAFVVVVGVGIWAKDRYDDRVVPVEAFMGLTLKDTPNDVKFKKGEPEVFDDDLWLYKDSDGNWANSITYKKDKIRAVSYTHLTLPTKRIV